MSTNRTFNNMINDFLPLSLLEKEIKKRDYFLQKVEKDNTWVGASSSNGINANGGALVVPFVGQAASSFQFGSLAASNDIAEDATVRGMIQTQPEMWGSMLFNHRDLMEHGKISERNFLKILPDRVESFLRNMKAQVSTSLINGAITKSTAGSTSATGVIVVDRVDRLHLKQKVLVGTTSPTTLTGYIQALDINTGSITLHTTRAGGTPLDFSANAAPAGSKINLPGEISEGFTALKNALLPAANGGSATLYGVTKTAYPFTQAIYIDGSGVNAANIIEKLFHGYTRTRILGGGAPTDILVSLRNLSLIMAVIEASKGAFNVVPGSQKASQYGWTEVMIGSVTNMALKFVGIREMDDDIAMFIDWAAMKFYTNGFVQRRKSPDGLEYYEERNTTGYVYIIDHCLFGDLVVYQPSWCGIMGGIAIAYPPELL